MLEILLGLVAKISRDYAFSAFVVALMMLLFYLIVTNKGLIRITDRALNKKLSGTLLYRVLRLGILLTFCFSALVVILAFITPVIWKSTQNRALELVLKAEGTFARKDFENARKMYERSLVLTDPDTPDADEIRGMISATYYENGLHIEGLEFICDQYRYKPTFDRSFLFNVHAHIRKISVTKGYAEAERIAKAMREKCDRPDFSEFWSHIPFGMMESLRVGTLRTEHDWVISPESQDRLTFLLDSKYTSDANTKTDFYDNALYFLGRFDELIAHFPESPIRDMALLDASRFSVGTRRIEYLRQFVKDYPKSLRLRYGIELLARELALAGMRGEAIYFVTKLSTKDAVESAIEALTPTFESLRTFVKRADFSAAKLLAIQVCKDFENNGLPCNPKITSILEKLNKAITFAKYAKTTHRCSEMQANIRKLARVDEHTLDHDWLRAVRVTLEGCILQPDIEPEEYARSLYLIASLSRRIGDYKTSLAYLLRFRREINDHDLLDDVIAEIGYHKLFIEMNWEKAKVEFEEVIVKYPSRNAYDNVLWWYAVGLKRHGDYASAILRYAEIASLQVESRFKEFSKNEKSALLKLSELPPFYGVQLKRRSKRDGRLMIAEISDEARISGKVKVGAILVEVCGERVYSVDELLKVVSKLSENTSCTIYFLHGKILFRISGTLNGEWFVDSLELTPPQLRDFIFG